MSRAWRKWPTRARSLTTAFYLLALSSGACWLRLGVGTGSVQLSWTFNRGEGCHTAGVNQVQVSEGDLVATFPCDDDQDGGTTGILARVPAGTQLFTLTGLGQVYDPDAGSAGARPIYRASLSLDVAEESVNIPAVVDLAPLDASGSSGDLLLLWTFKGHDCAAAEVVEVTIVLDGGAAVVDGGFAGFGDQVSVPCAPGLDQGVRFTGLAQGLHAFALAASRPGTTYVAAPTAYLTGYSETIQHVDLHPLEEELTLSGAALTLELELSFGASAGSCASSGVDRIPLELLQSYFEGGAGEILDGQPQPAQCLALPILDQEQSCSQPSTVVIVTTAQSAMSEAPCDFVQTNGSGLCPLSAGEYLLNAQGITGSSVSFDLQAYDFWMDDGIGDGVLAGMVPGYGYARASPRSASVTSIYPVNLPAASGQAPP